MVIWLLIAFVWIMIHRLHEFWASLASVRPVMACVVCLGIAWLLSSKEKRPLGNIFTPAMLGFTVAMTLATLFSPFTNVLTNDEYHNWLRFMVFFVIMMTSVKTEKDLKFVVTAFTIIVFLYMSHCFRGYLNGNRWYIDGMTRLKGLNTIYGDPNDYGTMIVFSLPMLFPLLTLCKKNWHYLFILGYTLLSLRSVQLTGSRTAFIMAVMLFILPLLLSKHRFRILPFIFVAIFLGWFSMSEEAKNRYRTIWDSSINETANANRDGRLVGFYDGLENWSNYPLTGVGVGMHGPARGQIFASHNLAGQVVGETGTLGTIAFLFMISCFGINHYSIWKNYKYLQEKKLGKEGLYCWRVSLGIVYAVLMMLLQGIGLHNAFRFPWVLFAAYHALTTMIMQEKVDAAILGKLRPTLEIPTMKK